MIRTLATTTLFACGALAPIGAMAASIGECGTYTSDIRSIVEPWQDFTRTFANGTVRVVLIDTAEPAAAAFHLVVLHPPADEMDGWGCSVVSDDDGRGFNGINFPALEAAEDPAGVTLVMPAGSYSGETDTTRPLSLTVTVNLAAGTVTAEAQ